MSVVRARMREVDVVEAADAAADEPPVRRRVRVRPRWVVAALVVVAGLVAAQLALDAHGRAADARLARVAGAVAPLRAAPHVAWTVTGAEAQVVAQGLAADGVAVGLRPRADGSRDAVGIGLDDGKVRWSVVLDGPDDLRALTPSPDADAACRLVPGVQPAQVACVTTNRVATAAYGLYTVRRGATRGHLVVLEVATGRTVVDRAAPPSPTFVALPGELVVARTGADERPHVAGEDLATGAARWDDALAPMPGGSLPGLVAMGPRALAVLDGSRSAQVIAADGRVLQAAAGPLAASGVTPAGDLWLVSGVHVGSGDGLVTSRLVRADGVGLEVTGRIDPGADPRTGLVVTTGAQVRAFAPGGAPRWTAEVPTTRTGALVLPGMVAVATDAGLVALARDDGRRLWRVGVGPDVEATSLLTDGVDVLAVESGPGGVALVAHRTSDGSVRWRVPLPSGDVRALGRALVVVSSGSVSRLAA